MVQAHSKLLPELIKVKSTVCIISICSQRSIFEFLFYFFIFTSSLNVRARRERNFFFMIFGPPSTLLFSFHRDCETKFVRNSQAMFLSNFARKDFSFKKIGEFI